MEVSKVMGVPKNEWFKMDNHKKNMHDWGVTPFQEASTSTMMCLVLYGFNRDPIGKEIAEPKIDLKELDNRVPAPQQRLLERKELEENILHKEVVVPIQAMLQMDPCGFDGYRHWVKMIKPP